MRYEQAQKGQAMIEILIALPIFLLTTFAVLQVGFLIYFQAVVDHAGFMITRAATFERLQSEDLLKRYRKLSKAFHSAPVQITVSLLHPTAPIPTLKISIKQGYRPIGYLFWQGLVKTASLSSQNKTAIEEVINNTQSKEHSNKFDHYLSNRSYLALHTEASLPLPINLRDYSPFVAEAYPDSK